MRPLMKKYAFVSIISMILGFSINFMLPKKEVKIMSAPVENPTRNFMADFSMDDYLKLKSEKEKYEKAEELYGKMMLMFLASIGMKEKSAMEQIVKERENYVKNLEERLLETNKLIAVKEATIANFELEKNKKSQEVEEVEKVKDSVVSNVMERFQKSSYMGSDSRMLLRDLFGEFSGNIFLNGKTYLMQVKSSLRKDGAKGLFGETNVILYNEEGKEVSNSTGKGDNRAFRSVQNRKNLVIVEISPGEFAELKYVVDSDYFTGQIYDKSGKAIGKVPGLYRR